MLWLADEFGPPFDLSCTLSGKSWLANGAVETVAVVPKCAVSVATFTHLMQFVPMTVVERFPQVRSIAFAEFGDHGIPKIQPFVRKGLQG